MAAPSRLRILKIVGLVIFAVVLVADLWSKAWMQDTLGLVLDQPVSARTIVVIDGLLAWQGTWNPGVTFGAFAGQTVVILILTGLATCALFVWFLGTRLASKCLHVGLALILAGAIGNLYDRIKWDQVRDFILFYSGSLEDPDRFSLFGIQVWPWPNFNIADAGIVCGVVLVLWDALFGLGAKDAKAKYLAKKAASESKAGA